MPRDIGTGILRSVPTYDYRCERTGEMFEMWQSFSDDTLTECPQTHGGESAVCGADVKKVFSKVGISFKGDGFYKNDHGSSPGSSSPTSTSAGTDSSSKDSSSTDSSSSSSSSDTAGASSSSD